VYLEVTTEESNRSVKVFCGAKQFTPLHRRVVELLDEMGRDLKVSIDPRHFYEIREVLREILGTLPADRQVQAKYYLSRSLADEIKKRAEDEGMTQSQYVFRCVVERISRKEKARARAK
jgi:hypothetical protein